MLSVGNPFDAALQFSWIDSSSKLLTLWEHRVIEVAENDLPLPTLKYLEYLRHLAHGENLHLPVQVHLCVDKGLSVFNFSPRLCPLGALRLVYLLPPDVLLFMTPRAKEGHLRKDLGALSEIEVERLFQEDFGAQVADALRALPENVINMRKVVERGIIVCVRHAQVHKTQKLPVELKRESDCWWVAGLLLAQVYADFAGLVQMGVDTDQVLRPIGAGVFNSQVEDIRDCFLVKEHLHVLALDDVGRHLHSHLMLCCQLVESVELLGTNVDSADGESDDTVLYVWAFFE